MGAASCREPRATAAAGSIVMALVSTCDISLHPFPPHPPAMISKVHPCSAGLQFCSAQVHDSRGMGDLWEGLVLEDPPSRTVGQEKREPSCEILAPRTVISALPTSDPASASPAGWQESTSVPGSFETRTQADPHVIISLTKNLPGSDVR